MLRYLLHVLHLDLGDLDGHSRLEADEAVAQVLALVLGEAGALAELDVVDVLVDGLSQRLGLVGREFERGHGHSSRSHSNGCQPSSGVWM